MFADDEDLLKNVEETRRDNHRDQLVENHRDKLLENPRDDRNGEQ